MFSNYRFFSTVLFVTCLVFIVASCAQQPFYQGGQAGAQYAAGGEKPFTQRGPVWSGKVGTFAEYKFRQGKKEPYKVAMFNCDGSTCTPTGAKPLWTVTAPTAERINEHFGMTLVVVQEFQQDSGAHRTLALFKPAATQQAATTAAY